MANKTRFYFFFRSNRLTTLRHVRHPILMNRWTHWDPLEYLYPCTVILLHFLLFLFLIRSATLAFIFFFVLPILPEWSASSKTMLQKNYLCLRRFECIVKHEVNGSKLSLHWLAQLFENLFVGGVFLRSRRFFLTLLSRLRFLHLKHTL